MSLRQAVIEKAYWWWMLRTSTTTTLSGQRGWESTKR